MYRYSQLHFEIIFQIHTMESLLEQLRMENGRIKQENGRIKQENMYVMYSSV